MNKITLAQREALDVVKDMIDRSNANVPEFGTKVITLILGILNVDCRVEHTITQIDGDKITPIINPDSGNDRIQINIPDWIKTMPTPPFIPGDKTSEPAPFPPQVWYNQETDGAIKTNAHEERRYATSVSCADNQNCITTTRNTDDCVSYTGDFRDVQTSFNDK